MAVTKPWYFKAYLKVTHSEWSHITISSSLLRLFASLLHLHDCTPPCDKFADFLFLPDAQVICAPPPRLLQRKSAQDSGVCLLQIRLVDKLTLSLLISWILSALLHPITCRRDNKEGVNLLSKSNGILFTR